MNDPKFLRFPIFLLVTCVGLNEARASEFEAPRANLIKTIQADFRDLGHLTGRPDLGPRVLTALAGTPRHVFVPTHLRHMAYLNRPLPIGHGQTISQPFIVAIMTELLDLKADDVVLEVGTGSGYQAAILAAVAKRVYTIEIVEPLYLEASDRLARNGYDNVETRFGDGYYGWSEAAPFNAIVVTAAANHIPPPLIQQLSPGGKMAIPVGDRFTTQQLLLVEKGANGKVRTRHVLPVIFVPLTGEH